MAVDAPTEPGIPAANVRPSNPLSAVSIANFISEYPAPTVTIFLLYLTSLNLSNLMITPS